MCVNRGKAETTRATPHLVVVRVRVVSSPARNPALDHRFDDAASAASAVCASARRAKRSRDFAICQGEAELAPQVPLARFNVGGGFPSLSASSASLRAQATTASSSRPRFESDPTRAAFTRRASWNSAAAPRRASGAECNTRSMPRSSRPSRPRSTRRRHRSPRLRVHPPRRRGRPANASRRGARV